MGEADNEHRPPEQPPPPAVVLAEERGPTTATTTPSPAVGRISRLATHRSPGWFLFITRVLFLDFARRGHRVR
ncbi:MAG: hypothetical protein ACREQ5_12250 [Candidatus Dormibacteria bacterium]